MTTCYLRNVLSIVLNEIFRYYSGVKKRERERQKRNSVFEFGHNIINVKCYVQQCF